MSAPGPLGAEVRRRLRRAGFVGIVAGLLSFLSYVVLRRELAPGEFGTVVALLGVVAVVTATALTLPLLPFHRILTAEEAAQWKVHRPGLTRLGIFAVGAVSLVLLLTVLPFLSLPRVSLQMFTVLAVEAALAAQLSLILCRATKRMGLLAFLVIAGALVRLAGSALAGHDWPLAESGLGAFILAAALVALPVLQDYDFPPLAAEGRAVLRKLLLPLLAAASVALALGLFSQAHRIVAQSNFGAPDPANFGFVDLARFDDFQSAGLIAQIMLQVLFVPLMFFWGKRVMLQRTTRASLRWFWIYLGLLVLGVVLLIVGSPLANAIFTGDPAQFLPGLAAAVLMLGLVQGVGVFALASRRWAECFVLGACGIAYTVFLFYAGQQSQVMASCMFGGALMSLMLVLFVGIIRYARSHP